MGRLGICVQITVLFFYHFWVLNATETYHLSTLFRNIFKRIPQPTSDHAVIVEVDTKSCFNQIIYDWKAKTEPWIKRVPGTGKDAVFSNPHLLSVRTAADANLDVLMIHKDWSRPAEELASLTAINVFSKHTFPSEKFCILSSPVSNHSITKEKQHCFHCEKFKSGNISFATAFSAIGPRTSFLTLNKNRQAVELSLGPKEFLKQMVQNHVELLRRSFNVALSEATVNKKSKLEPTDDILGKFAKDLNTTQTVGQIKQEIINYTNELGAGFSVVISILSKMETLNDLGYDIEYPELRNILVDAVSGFKPPEIKKKINKKSRLIVKHSNYAFEGMKNSLALQEEISEVNGVTIVTGDHINWRKHVTIPCNPPHNVELECKEPRKRNLVVLATKKVEIPLGACIRNDVTNTPNVMIMAPEIVFVPDFFIRSKRSNCSVIWAKTQWNFTGREGLEDHGHSCLDPTSVPGENGGPGGFMAVVAEKVTFQFLNIPRPPTIFITANLMGLLFGGGRGGNNRETRSSRQHSAPGKGGHPGGLYYFCNNTFNQTIELLENSIRNVSKPREFTPIISNSFGKPGVYNERQQTRWFTFNGEYIFSDTQPFCDAMKIPVSQSFEISEYFSRYVSLIYENRHKLGIAEASRLINNFLLKDKKHYQNLAPEGLLMLLAFLLETSDKPGRDENELKEVFTTILNRIEEVIRNTTINEIALRSSCNELPPDCVRQTYPHIWFPELHSLRDNNSFCFNSGFAASIRDQATTCTALGQFSDFPQQPNWISSIFKVKQNCTKMGGQHLSRPASGLTCSNFSRAHWQNESTLLSNALVQLKPSTGPEDANCLNVYAKAVIGNDTSLSYCSTLPAFFVPGIGCHSNWFVGRARKFNHPQGMYVQVCEIDSPYEKIINECFMNYGALHPNFEKCKTDLTEVPRKMPLKTNSSWNAILHTARAYLRQRLKPLKTKDDIIVVDIKSFLEQAKTELTEYLDAVNQLENSNYVIARQTKKWENLNKTIEKRTTSIEKKIADLTVMMKQVVGPRLDRAFDDVKKTAAEVWKRLDSASNSTDSDIKELERLKKAASSSAITGSIFAFLGGIGDMARGVTNLVADYNNASAEVSESNSRPEEIQSKLDEIKKKLLGSHEPILIKYNNASELTQSVLDGIVSDLKVFTIEEVPDNENRTLILKKIEEREKLRKQKVQDFDGINSATNGAFDTAASAFGLPGFPTKSTRSVNEQNSVRKVKSTSGSIPVGKGLITGAVDAFAASANFKSLEEFADDLLKINRLQQMAITNVKRQAQAGFFALLNQTEGIVRSLTIDVNITSLPEITGATSILQENLQTLRVGIESIYGWLKLSAEQQLRNVFEGFTNALASVVESLRDIDNQKDKLEEAKLAGDLAKVLAEASDINVGPMHEVYQTINVHLRALDIQWYHDVWTSAFQQYIFPFAKSRLEDTNVQFNGTISEHANASLQHLNSVLTNLKLFETQIDPKVDPFQIERDFLEEDENFPPLAEWGEEFDPDVKALLTGKRVQLIADVLRSDENFHALKFKFIDAGLYIRGQSEKCPHQTEDLKKVLLGFGIKLIHSGVSYYRFANDYYRIQGEPLEMYFSFGKRLDGTPKESSKEYQKIIAGDFIFSPFTSWTFQLLAVNKRNRFSHLNKFSGCGITLALTGRGTFYNSSLVFDQDLDLELDRFYFADPVLRNISIVRNTPVEPLESAQVSLSNGRTVARQQSASEKSLSLMKRALAQAAGL